MKLLENNKLEYKDYNLKRMQIPFKSQKYHNKYKTLKSKLNNIRTSKKILRKTDLIKNIDTTISKKIIKIENKYNKCNKNKQNMLNDLMTIECTSINDHLKKHNLQKEIGAFLNNQIQHNISKSIIKIGISDITRTIDQGKSYTTNQRQDIEKIISMWSKYQFFPIASPYINTYINKSGVITITIIPPKDLVFYTKVGKKWIMYIRIGSSSEPVTPDNEAYILKKSNMYRYDQKCCSQQNLKFKQLTKIYNKIHFNKYIKSTDITKEIHGLYNTQNRYSNAGLFLSDESPIKTELNNYISNNEISSSIITGSIVKQIYQIGKKICKYCNLSNIYSESTEYPKDVIKEALFNAFTHRSYYYYENTKIKVNLYHDKIEITSPGSLPGNLSEKSIMRGATFIRNPIIFSILNNLKTKNIGGIQGIEEIYKKYNKYVSFNNTRNETSIVIPNLKSNVNNLCNSTNQRNKATKKSIDTHIINSYTESYSSNRYIRKQQQELIIILYLLKNEYITLKKAERVLKLHSTQANTILESLRPKIISKRKQKYYLTNYLKN